MADPLLDFDRDIAPVRNDFGFTRSESAFLNAKADQQIMPQLDLMVKLRGQIQKERASELAYETSLFEFKQRKKDIRDQRDADIRAEELLRPIQNIMENDELSPFEQSEQIGLIQLNNPDAFANSKIAQQSLLAANRFLSSKMQQRNEEMAKKLRKKTEKRADKKEKERLADTTGLDINFAYKYRDQADVDRLRERYLSDDVITDREAAILSNAEVALRENIRQQQDRSREEERAQRTSISRDKMASYTDSIKEIDNALRRLNTLDEDFDKDVDTAKTYYGEFEGVELSDGTILGSTKDTPISGSELRKQLSQARADNLRSLKSERDAAVADAEAELRRLRNLYKDEDKDAPAPKNPTQRPKQGGEMNE